MNFKALYYQHPEKSVICMSVIIYIFLEGSYLYIPASGRLWLAPGKQQATLPDFDKNCEIIKRRKQSEHRFDLA